MKSLIMLQQCVLDELGTWCCTSTIRDKKTVTERFEHEGASFLTITLPGFCKDFEKGLSRGFVAHDLFMSFSFTGGLPRFLGGFLEQVFDRSTGRLLDQPSIDAIFAVRQLTLLCSKLHYPCSPAREKQAMKGFVECEKQVREADVSRTTAEVARFARVSNLLWTDVLQSVNFDIWKRRVLPKHTSGSTADRLAGNRKYDLAEWTSRLEDVFPVGDYLLASWRHYSLLDGVNMLEPGAERPVRVISVPKTMKTPRIIAIEPTCMMFMQKAVSNALVTAIQSDSLVGSLVGFDDQVPNQELAKEGSLSGNLATLDLSEASDRVSNQLVTTMSYPFPHLAAGLDATRSRRADVRGEGIISLAKFASMGSALCFPIEAMVFLTVVVLGYQKWLNRPVTRGDISSLRGRVRVYGDDLVVPVEIVPFVVSELETFGFKVNSSKSFWTGRFRESCGKEYYDGQDVSIVKVRRGLPSQRSDVPEIVSTVALRNLMYLRGMWRTAGFLDSWLRSLIPLPVVLPTSPILGRVSFLGYETQRIHPSLFSPLVKGYVERNVIPESHLEGHGALYKCLSKESVEPFFDKRHLERHGRPETVDIKLRWASAI